MMDALEATALSHPFVRIVGDPALTQEERGFFQSVCDLLAALDLKDELMKCSIHHYHASTAIQTMFAELIYRKTDV